MTKLYLRNITPRAFHVGSLAASPDAKTIYFGAEGTIWSIPAVDGTPQKIADGDAVTVNPN